MNKIIIKRGIILICSYIAVAILGNLIVGVLGNSRSKEFDHLLKDRSKVADNLRQRSVDYESHPDYIKADKLLKENMSRGENSVFYNVEKYNSFAYKLGALILLCYVIAAIVWKEKLGGSDNSDEDCDL
jgi:hypothetical protein